MEQISALSITALFETTKLQRATFTSQIINAVNNGEIKPENLHLQMKCMAEIIKTITENEDYKKAVLEAFQKYGKSFEFMGNKVSISEVGTKYNYDNTMDSEIIDLLKKQDELKTKIKDRAEFLKALPAKGQIIVNELTGEMVTIYPPLKSSTTSPVITLK